MDDRLWMYHRVMDGHLRPEYITGVRRFINFVFSINKNVSGEKLYVIVGGAKIKSF